MIQRSETAWRRDSNWMARYSKLYSSRRISVPKEDKPQRISFMNNDGSPYQSLSKGRDQQNAFSLINNETQWSSRLASLTSTRSMMYSASKVGSFDRASDTKNISNETLLLDMVRSRNADVQAQDQTLNIPRDDASDDMSNEPCIHGWSVRMTERSLSRSRVSRISTRRDMDIPSILAFTATAVVPAVTAIPAFQKIEMMKNEDVPRWSIRRSLCPVCSQKWKDRSSIINVKNSGLKRNSSSDLQSIVVPARLKSSITMGYAPRPTLAAVDKDEGVIPGGLKNTSAIWQLTRARRFRLLKPQIPISEATGLPSVTAPLGKRDLDSRVHKFLKN